MKQPPSSYLYHHHQQQQQEEMEEAVAVTVGMEVDDADPIEILSDFDRQQPPVDVLLFCDASAELVRETDETGWSLPEKLGTGPLVLEHWCWPQYNSVVGKIHAACPRLYGLSSVHANP
ncbi:unnamed protein product [Musa hybrid cultivar]